MKRLAIFTSLLLAAACTGGGTSNNGQSGTNDNSQYNNNPNQNNTNTYSNNNQSNQTMGDMEATMDDSDWTITWKVKQALIVDKDISWKSRFVQVTTNNGVVTLAGNVANQDDMDMIMQRVKSVNGVQSIDNQMKVIMNQ